MPFSKRRVRKSRVCCANGHVVCGTLTDTSLRICYRLAMTRVFLLSVLLLVVPFASAKDRYQRSGRIHLDRNGEKWAEKALKKMSPEEKVGQVFMIWVRAQFMNLESPDYLQLRDTIQRDHIGSFAMTVPVDGPLLIKSQPYEAAMLLNQLQRDSKLPLLIAADFERGVSLNLEGSADQQLFGRGLPLILCPIDDLRAV